jgi:hypothetical protein
MTRQLMSSRVLAAQLVRSARSASDNGLLSREAEAFRCLEQVNPGLQDWERDEVLRGIRFCIAARQP